MKVLDVLNPFQERRHGAFSLPIRVYNQDIDSGRVVFAANYLNFMERARTEWLHSIGVNQRQMERERRMGFVMRDIRIEFLNSARLDDVLDITVQVGRLGRSSIVLKQDAFRGKCVLCYATLTAVCINVVRCKAVSIPPDIRVKFENDMKGSKHE